jgi:hypothetical protein
MKSVLIAIIFSSLAFASNFSFANNKGRNPASDIPNAVKDSANRMKREVRTRISAYNVSAEEANGCSSEGLHYNIKLQVKKAVRALDKNENVTVKYTWETVREWDTEADGRPMEICLE